MRCKTMKEMNLMQPPEFNKFAFAVGVVVMYYLINTGD